MKSKNTFIQDLINSLWRRKLFILSWNFKKRTAAWFPLASEDFKSVKGSDNMLLIY